MRDFNKNDLFDTRIGDLENACKATSASRISLPY